MRPLSHELYFHCTIELLAPLGQEQEEEVVAVQAENWISQFIDRVIETDD